VRKAGLLLAVLIWAGCPEGISAASVADPYVLICIDPATVEGDGFQGCPQASRVWIRPTNLSSAGSLVDLSETEIADLVAAALLLWAVAWVFKTIRKLIGGRA
jgi:hypothetical protein